MFRLFACCLGSSTLRGTRARTWGRASPHARAKPTSASRFVMKCPSVRRRSLQRRWKARQKAKVSACKAPKHKDPGEDAKRTSRASPASLTALRRLPQAEQRRRLLELLNADLGREEDGDVEDESWRMPELNVEARTASADGMCFETRMCWMQHLGDEELERMLKTCRLVFALDGSSWMPSHETPRCFAERLAMAVFRHHTVGCRFDPARSGAEWWAQVRQSGHHEEGIQFHWDTDEVAVERHNVNVHPHLSTVTYLSDSGAPTLVLACRNARRPSLTSAYGPIHEGALSWPKLWKHLVFDGQFLHGTVPSVEYSKSGPRVTFLVNVWLNHRPSNCHRLPKSLSTRLGDAPLPPSILTEAIRPPLHGSNQHSDATKFESTFGRRSLSHRLACCLPRTVPPSSEGRTVLLQWPSQDPAMLGPLQGQPTGPKARKSRTRCSLQFRSRSPQPSRLVDSTVGFKVCEQSW